MNASRSQLLRLRQALFQPEEIVAETKGKIEAAVLVPIYEQAGELHVVFTRRHADLRNHPGEISFPGGRREHPGETLVETALRETNEEVGLQTNKVELLGALPPVSTWVSGFIVFPFVGLIEHGEDWLLAEAEVSEVLEIPLNHLRTTREQRRLLRRGLPMRTYVYPIGNEIIWGATARILGELLERIPEDATD